MKSRKQFTLITVIYALTLLACISMPRVVASSPNAAFITNRVTFIAGQAQTLRYVIKNNTVADITLSCVQAFNVDIDVKDSKGNEAPQGSHVSRVFTRCIPTTLASGRTLTLNLDLLGWGYKLTPGEYNASARFLGANDSNISHIHISVRPG